MVFSPQIKPEANNTSEGIYFVFQKGRLLVKSENDCIILPAEKDIHANGITVVHKQYLGALNTTPCFAGEVEATIQSGSYFEFKDLRALITTLDEEMVSIAGRANQLVYWNKAHRYCGACGHATHDKTDERAKICPRCGLTNYPRLSPAIIVAVVRDDKILLARNQRFKLPMYSVLAGFVEPGETLEACIHREIKEEVGVAVKNIRYFGSQPWPFPDSLMIAFTADYESGEVEVDPSELLDAQWFTKDNLPQVPTRISIAGQLIEWFRRKSY